MIVDPLYRPARAAGRTAAALPLTLARAVTLVLAAGLSLTACTPSQPQPSSSSAAPSASLSASAGTASPDSTGTASAGAPGSGAGSASAGAGSPGPSGQDAVASGDQSTFVAEPPTRASGSAPDAGACVNLKEESVRAALGSAAPASLTPFASEDAVVEGFPGAVRRECTMKLGPEPGHTVSVSAISFPDAAAARSYGVAPKGFTADPVSGVGDSAAFVAQKSAVEVGYYLFVGRGADVFRFRIGQPARGSGTPAMDAAAGRDALVKLAKAAGL